MFYVRFFLDDGKLAATRSMHVLPDINDTIKVSDMTQGIVTDRIWRFDEQTNVGEWVDIHLNETFD